MAGKPNNCKQIESQLNKIANVKEVLRLSEALIIKALKGEMSGITDKVRLTTALELYKRRIPVKSEGDAGSNRLTIIKVVKNYIPEEVVKDTIDINMTGVELLADKVVKQRLDTLE